MDERAVVPETGTEMIHGELRKVAPAEPPHADQQCDAVYVIRSHVAPGYIASTELLTRVNQGSDFATDACIRKAGRDPETGARHLEELSFEVKHTQRNADITERARMLSRRGVRRVFAIHVAEGEDGVLRAGPVKEWLASEDRWLDLHPDAEIADRCLVHPIKVRALIDATEANKQVARALLAQDNPVLVDRMQEYETQLQAQEARAQELAERYEQRLQAQEARVQELAERQLLAQKELAERYEQQLQAQKELAERYEGQLQAQAREAILALCEALDIEVTSTRRARMDAMAREELATLLAAIRKYRRWPAAA